MMKLTQKGLGKDKNTTYHLRQFDSLDEVLHYSKKVRDPKCASGWSKRNGGGGFFDSDTYEQAWDRAFNGWDTVRPTVDATLESLREQVRDLVDLKPVRVHDMIGFEPDIDRYVSGEIECMWDELMVETPHAGKVFTVLLDASLSSSQDADDIIKRGAVVIALIEAFQMFGFELEIWVENTCGSTKSEYHTTLVPIQRAGTRPDINAIMFPLANPDWCRRIVFGVKEGEPQKIRNDFGFTERGWYGWARKGAHMGERIGASIELSLEHTAGLRSLDPIKFIKEQLITQGVLDDPDAD